MSRAVRTASGHVRMVRRHLVQSLVQLVVFGVACGYLGYWVTR